MLQLRLLGTVELRGADGGEIRAVLRQPKRLALLAYLAVEGAGRFVRRDTLLALFWPELDDEHARAALRRAVWFLRKALGQDAIVGRGDEELALAAAAVGCDAAELVARLEQGDVRGALALYRGDVLPGFYIAGAPEAEQWLDGLRGQLRARAGAAAWGLAELAATPAEEAAAWGRRAARIEGEDADALTRLMRLLDRTGDAVGALEVYAQLERRLAAEDERPAPGTVDLARAIASRATRDRSPPGSAAPAPMLVAVLPFAVHGDPALEYLGEGAVALLTTALDGLGTLRTVTTASVMTRLAAAGDGAAGERRAAEHLAATHVLRGSIVASGGRLRVVAALETAGGETVARAEANAGAESGVFDALDAIAQQIVGGIAARPSMRIAGVAARTTGVLPALRAYLAGERAFRLGRFGEARDAYAEAVRHDEEFTLGWYRLAGSRATVADIAGARVASARAVAGADRLAPRDRLLVEAQDAWLAGRMPDAERRYATAVAMQPEDLEAWYLLGDALFHAAPYHGRSIREAREPLGRALALDPAHLGALHKLARLDALDGCDAEHDANAERFLRLSPDADQALAVRTLRAFRLRRVADKAGVLAELRHADALAVAAAFGDAALYGGALDEVAAMGAMFVPAMRSPELRALARLMLGYLAVARGRTAAAVAAFDAARADDARWSLEAETVLLAWPGVPLGADRAAATRSALAALDTTTLRPNVIAPLDLHNTLHAQIQVYGLGLLAAREGNVSSVAVSAELLSELEVPRWASALVQRMARTLDALIRRARGDTAGALAAIEGADADVWYQFAIATPVLAGAVERLVRAELLMDAGRHGEAVGWLDAIGERSPWELPFVAPARALEARCHEVLGDPAGAARCWREVARWYDGADGSAAEVRENALASLTRLGASMS